MLLVDANAVPARLAGSGRVRGLAAENLIMKQQLLVVGRCRRRAPNLSSIERSVAGHCALLGWPGPLSKVTAGVRTPTLRTPHQCLVRRKYRLLFSARRSGRMPSPKEPSFEPIRATVKVKRRSQLFAMDGRLGHILVSYILHAARHGVNLVTMFIDTG